jgi:hypothetical protein
MKRNLFAMNYVLTMVIHLVLCECGKHCSLWTRLNIKAGAVEYVLIIKEFIEVDFGFH